MRRAVIWMLVAAASCGAVYAQRGGNPEAYYRAPSTMHGKTVVLPAGTTFEGRMDGTVGSRLSHAGERFTITLSAPILANGVDVIIPAGSQVIGEVVEAIPASKLPHEKNMPKPTGKLRVQLNGLQTPDGVNFPLVASMAGETITMGRRTMNNPNLGSGVGYMGSAASFEAVAPGMSDRNRGRGGRGPQVVTKQQMMRDAIYGMGNTGNSMDRMAKPTIRSLVKREHDLYIDSGSPITIRLDAPFKIGVNPVNPGDIGGAPGFGGSESSSSDGGGRRFSRGGNSTSGGGEEPFPGDTAGSGSPRQPDQPDGAPAQPAPQAPQPAPVQQPSGQDNF